MNTYHNLNGTSKKTPSITAENALNFVSYISIISLKASNVKTLSVTHILDKKLSNRAERDFCHT